MQSKNAMKKLVALLLTISFLIPACSKQDAVGVIWVPILLTAAIATPFISTTANVGDAFPENKQDRALAKAAGEGDVEKISSLVAEGADVNATGKGGLTILGWALYKQNIDGFSKLIDLGADPNIQWKRDELPANIYMWFSVMHSAHGPFLRKALEGGGDPNLNIDDNLPIHGDLADPASVGFKALEEYGVDLFVVSEDGQTLLSIAAQYKYYKTVYYLMGKGVDFRYPNKWGRPFSDDLQLEMDKPDFFLDNERCDAEEKMWFWRCVRYMQERGVEFDISPKTAMNKLKFDKPVAVN